MSNGPGFLSDSGVSEAADAFQAAMDAESGQRSNRATRTDDDKPAKMALEDLFPQRNMDRSEREGGQDEPPPRREQEAEDDEDEAREYDDDESDDREDEEEQEDTEDEEEQPQEATGGLDFNQVIQTTIDGELVELPLGEAIRSGMRERTFHKYMSQLDLAVRESNQQRANLHAQYQAHEAAVQEFDAWVNELIPQPDWPTLFRADAGKAMALKVEWEEMEKKRSNIRAHLAATSQQRANDEMRALHNFANASRSQLAAWHPEWKDEKVWRRDHNSMRQTAKSVGYTDDDVNALYDARGGQILWMASKWARLMAKPPKPVKQGFTSGKRNGATPSRNVTRAFDRAERRPNRGSAKESLEATFERMLDREG